MSSKRFICDATESTMKCDCDSTENIDEEKSMSSKRLCVRPSGNEPEDSEKQQCDSTENIDEEKSETSERMSRHSSSDDNFLDQLLEHEDLYSYSANLQCDDTSKNIIHDDEMFCLLMGLPTSLKEDAICKKKMEKRGDSSVNEFHEGLNKPSCSSKQDECPWNLSEPEENANKVQTFEALSVEANEYTAGDEIDSMPSTSSVNEILQPDESSGLEKPPSDSSVNYKAEPEHPLVEEDITPVQPEHLFVWEGTALVEAEHPFAEEDKSLANPEIMVFLNQPIEPLPVPVTMAPFMGQLAEPSGSYNDQLNRYRESNNNLVVFTGGSPYEFNNPAMPNASAFMNPYMQNSSAFMNPYMPNRSVFMIQDMPSASTSYNASVRYAAGTVDDPIVLE